MCALAARAALGQVRVPSVSPFRSALTREMDFAVVEDPAEARALDVTRVPLVVTLAAFGETVLHDPTADEATHADATLVAAVTPQGQLTFSRMAGTAGLAPSLLFSMLTAAKEAAVLAVRSLDEALENEKRMQKPKVYVITN